MVRRLTTILSLLIMFSGCAGESQPPPTKTNEIITYSSTDETNSNTQVGFNEIIQMPESNSNTKIITIELPSEFVFSPYVKPDLVYIRNFEFGGYMPFVRYSVASMTAEKVPVYEYAFLEKNIQHLDEGNGLYEILNHKYEKNYPIVDSFKGRYSRESFPKKEILNYFYKSRIVFVSQDGKRVANFSVLDAGKTGYNGEQAWGQQLDIYESSNILYSKQQNSEGEYFSDNRMVYDVDYTYTLFDLQGLLLSSHSVINYDKNIEFKIETRQEDVLNTPNNTNYLLTIDRRKQELHIYSFDEMSLDYIIKIPENLEVNQLLNGSNLLVTFSDYKEQNFKGFYNHTWLFNLDTLEMKYLGSYLFNPLLSPDGKYLAYVKVHGTGSHEYMDDINHFDEMDEGFYIQNLETGETVFYPVKGDGYEYDIINWVNEKGLEELLGISLSE